MLDFKNEIENYNNLLTNQIYKFEQEKGDLEEIILEEFFLYDENLRSDLKILSENLKFDKKNASLSDLKNSNLTQKNIHHKMNIEDDFLNPDLECLIAYEKELNGQH